jgi:peptide/histidine transporter 3/4
MMHFFSWFFFISLGSLLAVTVLIYIYVQDNDNLGRRWGYGACTASLVVFLAGIRCRYRFKKLVGARPRRSLLSSCCMALAPPPAVRRPCHAL